MADCREKEGEREWEEEGGVRGADRLQVNRWMMDEEHRKTGEVQKLNEGTWCLHELRLKLIKVGGVWGSGWAEVGGVGVELKDQ